MYPCHHNLWIHLIFVTILKNKVQCNRIIFSMAIPVVEFQGRDTKLEMFLAKNQHTQRKSLNFENWRAVKNWASS